MNHICLQSRLTAESVLMFYIYIAAGPIYSLKEALASVLATALAAIPAFRAHHVPPALYSNLFLQPFSVQDALPHYCEQPANGKKGQG